VIDPSVEAMLEIRDRMFASGQALGVLQCFSCEAPTLEVRFERYGDRGAVFFQCSSCSFVDHLGRQRLPARDV
jgi:hypothetical protein